MGFAFGSYIYLPVALLNFTLALVNAATSTATGGGAFVFGGPPNQTNQYPR